MQKKKYPFWCEINLSHLRRNVLAIKKKIGKTKLMAVLKSDAYGHGICEIGKFLDAINEVECFGVYAVSEGVTLREAQIKKRIIVLGPVTDEKQYDLITQYDLEFMLLGMDELSALILRPEKKFKVHIKIDTGLHRFGFDPDQLPQILDIISSHKNIIPVGVASHLASLEDGMMDYTKKQMKMFDQALKIITARGLKLLRHIGAASVLLSVPEGYYDMVRVGISIYGLWPNRQMKNKYQKELNLQPVLSFKTRIIHRRVVEEGDFVGYGGTFQAKRDMIIAVLPVGYYEGIDRRMSNKGQVVIGGAYAPIIGRVAMNTTMIDISHLPQTRVGDEVTLIGEMISAEDMAEQIDTVPHEITTARIPSFVPKIYLR